MPMKNVKIGSKEKVRSLDRMLEKKARIPNNLNNRITNGYKFVSTNLESHFGADVMGSYKADWQWKVGKWYHTDKPQLGIKGFHAYKNLHSVYTYPSGGRLFKVDARGEVIGSEIMFAAEKMRLVKEIDVKRLSLAYAIDCAKRCLSIFEKLYSTDDRPRKAIEAAEAQLRAPSKENESTAKLVAESVAKSVEFANDLADKRATELRGKVQTPFLTGVLGYKRNKSPDDGVISAECAAQYAATSAYFAAECAANQITAAGCASQSATAARNSIFESVASAAGPIIDYGTYRGFNTGCSTNFALSTERKRQERVLENLVKDCYL